MAFKKMCGGARHARRVLALILAFGIPSIAAAQTGSIAGTVVDSETGETLIGANVLIRGTTTGTITNVDGRYALERLEPGSYDLVLSYIGYVGRTVTGVRVPAGSSVPIDVALVPESVGLDEVVVEARAVRNTEAALLKQRQKAVGIRDAISSEAIAQRGSSNAAEAASRITGASVVDGRFVYVRGLGGRYSSAQLNSTEMPGADPDRNAAQLDLIPSDLLDNIVATKTFTPDQPGSFSGGSIDVRTRSFPDALTFRISNSLAYNGAVSMSDRFLSGPSGPTDGLGYDGGLRALPEPFRQKDYTLPRPSQARNDPALARKLDAASRAFGNVMIPERGRAGVDQRHSLSFGNTFTMLGRRIGVVAGGTYSRAFDGYDSGLSAQYEATDPKADSLNVNFRFSDALGEQTTSWGLLTNASIRLHPHHDLAVHVLRTQDGAQLGRHQSGAYPKNTRPPVQFETYVLQYTEREMGSYQIRGEHYLEQLGDIRSSWNAAFVRTTQDEPDLRYFFDQFVHVDLSGDGLPDTTVYDINLGSSNATPPTRIFRSLVEDHVDLDLDIELPLDVPGPASVQLKAGGSMLRKMRTFRERKFNYRHNALDFRDFGGDIVGFFSAENAGIIGERAGRFIFGNTIEDGTRAANNYDGVQRVLAGYAMVDAQLFRHLRLVAGARYETTDLRIVSQDSTMDVGELYGRDLLPSLSLIYSPGDDVNLRLTAARTLARPTFREIAPFTSFSFAGGPELSGNPELRRTLITNLDARWEWFAGIGEVLAVGGFYKRFRSPIERVFVSNNNQVSYVNVPGATVVGLEVEVRKGMGWITDPLRHLTAHANLALIQSSVEIPARERTLAADFRIGDTRPFQGQSPYVLNVGLSYVRSDTGTSASLSLHRSGARLSSVALGGAPNVFERPRSELYVSAGQDVFDLVHVKLSIANLLDADFVESQRYRGAEFVTRRHEIGRTVQVAVSYDL